MRFIYLAFVLVLAACAQTPNKNSATPSPAPQAADNKEMAPANLTWTEAQFRKTQVGNVDYALEIGLDNKAEAFNGVANIFFEWTGKGSELRLDFYRGTITSFEVNGILTPYTYDNVSLRFKTQYLKAGVNSIKVVYTHPYSDDGEGLTRFEDSEDKRVYLHTQFETYSANRMFPCFDQPDLKGTYRSKITAPKDWQIISSTRETSIKPEGEKKVWTFPVSAKFSTYLFSLHAGPYKVWEDKFANIPLRLFARQSLAKYVDPIEWFTYTKQGLSFFNRYFDYPYPYKKYDQVIAPSFMAGAMENVAAVTFAEFFISRGPRSHNDKRDLAEVLLHEMAHMWFGDLVTMKWWNDLWLNESFATIMSYLASHEATVFKESWRMFAGQKSGSAWEDQLVTTHPIETKIDDLLQANTSFDGITYGKGASVMRQLMYYIGPDQFRKGVQIYFKRFAEGNTERKDFMAAMSEASGRDLTEWQTLWLQTANLNSIEPKFSCEGGKIASFEIAQTAPDSHPTLRPHAMNVALFSENKGQFKVAHLERVEVQGKATPVASLVGKTCPAMVFPNYEDHGYFKVILDPKSLSSLKTNIAGISDTYLRQMLWATLWDMVRDAKFDFRQYADMALNQGIAKESDDVLLRQIFSTLNDRLSVLTYYYQSPEDLQKTLSSYLEQYDRIIWTRLRQAGAGSELQKIFFDALVGGAQTQLSLTRIEGFYNGRIKLPGLVIDQDRRWELLGTLVSHGFTDAEKWIEAEAKRDKSSKGEDNRFATEIAVPRWEAKARLIEEFKAEKPAHPFYQLRMGVWYAFPRNQIQLRLQYGPRFFEDLKMINKKSEGFVASTFSSMAPFSCLSDVTALDRFLRSESGLDPSVVKRLKRFKNEQEKCRAVINTARTAASGTSAQ